MLGDDPKLTESVQQMIHEIQRFHITCIDELKRAEIPQHTDLELEKSIQESLESDTDIDDSLSSQILNLDQENAIQTLNYRLEMF